MNAKRHAWTPKFRVITALVALAASLYPTSVTAQASPSPAPSSDFSEGSTLILAVVFIGSGLLAAAIVGGFLAYVVGKFYEAEMDIAQAIGRLPNWSFAPSGLETRMIETEAGYHISGPTFPRIGRDHLYELRSSDGKPVTGSVTWRVDPEVADLTPERQRVRVKPRIVGPMWLAAEVSPEQDEEQKQSIRGAAHKLVSVAGSGTRGGQGLPFLGSGYGSLLALPLVLGMVGALGVAKVLDGQGVAAAVSAVVGFVVGHTAAVSGRSNGARSRGRDGEAT